MNPKEFIAKKAASFLKSGDVVNLGIGIPTLVGDYIEDGVLLHTENGLIGYGETPAPGDEDDDFVGAGTQYLSPIEGASVFDSALSFAIIRGGHLKATMLGALEVDQDGSIANWALPGRMVGMGGAMDLVKGAPEVIALLDHTNKDGSPKIVQKCTLPLTGKSVLTKIITEFCVLEVTQKGLVVKEMVEGLTQEELAAKTGANLIFPDEISIM